MRERRLGDWRVDLARRQPLERFVEDAIDEHDELHRLASHTTSLDRLDYHVIAPGERLCEVELKAKHQRYSAWGQLRPDTAERDLFILDELTLRKLITAGKYGFLLVNDQPQHRWVVWSTMDLVLASKVRVNRRLVTDTTRFKAKILLDLTETKHHHDDVDPALSAIAKLATEIDRDWNSITNWPTVDALPTAG